MKKIVYLAVALALTACGGNNVMPTAGNDFAVKTVEPTEATLSTSYPATIKGVQDIEIRPRVTGNIMQVLVDEGDYVHAGQALFIIDRVQYEAAVKSAQAAINVIKSNIATQELTVKNQKVLFDKGIISQYDYDTQVNTLESLKAQLAQAEAQLVDARNNLSYCTVTSPADGYIGTIPYRVGSLVSASTAQPLTTVSKISQMYVYFSMTEKQMLELTKSTGGIAEAMEQMPKVNLVLSDGTTYAHQGTISAVSGVIDQTTGSVQMRATFDNPDRILRSGGMASVVFPTTMSEALLVPQKATFEIQNKKFVYVVNDSNKVASREITVMSQNDGKSYVVTSGLKAGERIVLEGVSTMKEGQEINPITEGQSAQMREDAKEDMREGRMPGQ